jgi:hypothetical protein
MGRDGLFAMVGFDGQCMTHELWRVATRELDRPERERRKDGEKNVKEAQERGARGEETRRCAPHAPTKRERRHGPRNDGKRRDRHGGRTGMGAAWRCMGDAWARARAQHNAQAV